MAKASKNTAAKSASEKGKKNSKSTEPGTASKRGLKGHENSAKADDDDSVPPEIEWTEELAFQMLTEITEDEEESS
ncbi:hypothetical protein BDR07DRAFT_1484397 [Suillus spraguei]|nr:hypothetical protein BDR07DRAFT_1484397 [Suillus spraguei]